MDFTLPPLRLDEGVERRAVGFLDETMEQDDLAGVETEQGAADTGGKSGADFPKSAPKRVDPRQSKRPAVLNRLDVDAHLPALVGRQTEQPLPHGLVARSGSVEGARDGMARETGWISHVSKKMHRQGAMEKGDARGPPPGPNVEPPRSRPRAAVRRPGRPRFGAPERALGKRRSSHGSEGRLIPPAPPVSPAPPDTPRRTSPGPSTPARAPHAHADLRRG